MRHRDSPVWGGVRRAGRGLIMGVEAIFTVTFAAAKSGACVSVNVSGPP
jgi:hypothetical protein